jgi:hypothetical protein
MTAAKSNAVSDVETKPFSPAIPQILSALMKKIKTAYLIPPEYASFKSTLLNFLKKL